MITKHYAGIIGEDNYGFLSLDNESIASMIEEDWKPGTNVSVRLFISSKPFPIEQASSMLVSKLYGGALDVEYILDAYSEWTVEAWEQGLSVGGHNLINELQSHMGKYALIIVNDVCIPC